MQHEFLQCRIGFASCDIGQSTYPTHPKMLRERTAIFYQDLDSDVKIWAFLFKVKTRGKSRTLVIEYPLPLISKVV